MSFVFNPGARLLPSTLRPLISFLALSVVLCPWPPAFLDFFLPFAILALRHSFIVFFSLFFCLFIRSLSFVRVRCVCPRFPMRHLAVSGLSNLSTSFFPGGRTPVADRFPAASRA